MNDESDDTSSLGAKRTNPHPIRRPKVEDALKLMRSGNERAREVVSSELRAVVMLAVRSEIGGHVRRYEESGDIVQPIVLEIIEWALRRPELTWPGVMREASRRARERVVDASRRTRHRDLGESSIEGGTINETPALAATRLTLHDRQLVEQLVDHLPADFAAIVRCIAIEGLSQNEVARRLGVHPSVVRRQYRKACVTLTKAFKRHGLGPE